MEFIKACPNSPQRNDTVIYAYLRTKAQDLVISTLEYKTFIQGAAEKNVFVSSFPNGEVDFDAWVDNLEQIKTFPDGLGNAFINALNAKDLTEICDLLCIYIDEQDLARSNKVK